MKLLLKRNKQIGLATVGELYIDGVFFCYTLEDASRAVKIPKETCIPKGTYKVVIDHSQRFGRLMPHVLDVPGFEGIRIHTGNTIHDTEGCILVGKETAPDGKVLRSREAFVPLFQRLQEASNIELTIC